MDTTLEHRNLVYAISSGQHHTLKLTDGTYYKSGIHTFYYLTLIFMPANPKYLTTSSWVKFGKLSAAIIGSLIATISFHLALATWLTPTLVWGTSVFSMFILWAGLIVVTYWLHKLWHIWSILSLIIFLSTVAIYLGQAS